MIGGSSYVLIRQYFRKVSTSTHLFRAGKVDNVSIKGGNAEIATSAVKDIVLYKFESPRFFKFLNLFAITQYGFWTFISVSSMSMVDVPVSIPETPTKEDEDLPFWRKINLGSDKYKYGLTVGSALMGASILFLSWMYILRSVRYLVLRKDGQIVSFVTYAPFGKNRIMNVPLSNISAEGSRTSGTSQMPVRVKGKRLYYLLDLKEGKFVQPQLFDKTVGTKRRLQ